MKYIYNFDIILGQDIHSWKFFFLIMRLSNEMEIKPFTVIH